MREQSKSDCEPANERANKRAKKSHKETLTPKKLTHALMIIVHLIFLDPYPTQARTHIPLSDMCSLCTFVVVVVENCQSLSLFRVCECALFNDHKCIAPVFILSIHSFTLIFQCSKRSHAMCLCSCAVHAQQPSQNYFIYPWYKFTQLNYCTAAAVGTNYGSDRERVSESDRVATNELMVEDKRLHAVRS